MFRLFQTTIDKNYGKNCYLNNFVFLSPSSSQNYLDHMFSSNQIKLKDTPDVYYFKLLYIDHFSHHIGQFKTRTEEHIEKGQQVSYFQTSTLHHIMV